MGHAPDCAVNGDPADLPGPRNRGLDVSPLDPIEALVPIVLVGAWRSSLAVREPNLETFIKTKQTKIRGGGIRLRIDLIDSHSWSIFPRGADHLNFYNAPSTVVFERQAQAFLSCFDGQSAIARCLKYVLGSLGCAKAEGGFPAHSFLPFGEGCKSAKSESSACDARP